MTQETDGKAKIEVECNSCGWKGLNDSLEVDYYRYGEDGDEYFTESCPFCTSSNLRKFNE